MPLRLTIGPTQGNSLRKGTNGGCVNIVPHSFLFDAAPKAITVF